MDIGVIGGADGPTRIIVQQGNSPYIIAALVIACAVAIGLLIWSIRRGKKIS